MRIEERDENFNSIIADTIVRDNNFKDLIEMYLSKSSVKLNNDEISSLEKILLWMNKNDIETISVKTPEFNHITILLSSDSGLRYQNIDYKTPEIEVLSPISKNWYFIKYK